MSNDDEMKRALLASMYEQEEEIEERAQPEQLRLAGKATLMKHGAGQVALARVEYVEALERTVREQQKMLDAAMARIKKLEFRLDRSMNIAGRKIAAVESNVKDIQERPFF